MTRASLTVSFAMAACSSHPPAALPMAAPVSELTLGHGAVIDIRVWDEPEASGVFRLDAAGAITHGFCGSLTVLARTAEQVSDMVRTCLLDGYIRQPQVSVLIKESGQSFSVFGQVRAPGQYPFQIGLTVISAIGTAGGPTNMAMGRVWITRGQQRFAVELDAITTGEAPDVSLQPGDTLFVPEAIF